MVYFIGEPSQPKNGVKTGTTGGPRSHNPIGTGCSLHERLYVWSLLESLGCFKANSKTYTCKPSSRTKFTNGLHSTTWRFSKWWTPAACFLNENPNEPNHSGGTDSYFEQRPGARPTFHQPRRQACAPNPSHSHPPPPTTPRVLTRVQRFSPFSSRGNLARRLRRSLASRTLASAALSP